jgi:hypothetical protein
MDLAIRTQPDSTRNRGAEREGFEPSVSLPTSAFKAGAFVRSATVPSCTLGASAPVARENPHIGRFSGETRVTSITLHPSQRCPANY